MLMLQKEIRQLKNKCSRIENQGKQRVLLIGRKKKVEVNGEDNSIDLENKNLDKRAIHIHGGMEHNMAKYAKYYSYGRKKISRSYEFTRKFNYSRRDSSKHW